LCRPDRKIVAQASLRDRRIDLLEAAARPFVGQGFAATSLDGVSDEIGSASAAIYCYYRGKPNLFLAVHRRALELARRVIRPPRESEGKVLERLRGTASAHAALVMEQLPYLRAGDQELELHLLERTKEGERAELADVGMRREDKRSPLHPYHQRRHYIRRAASDESTLGGKIFARRSKPDIAPVAHARGRIRRRTNGGVDRRIRREARLK
jgi:AcrR family transcriptional regulator